MDTPPFQPETKMPVRALLPEKVCAQCPRVQQEAMQFRATATQLVFHGAQIFSVGCNQLGAAGTEREHYCSELDAQCPLHSQTGTFRSQLVEIMVDEHQWLDEFKEL